MRAVSLYRCAEIVRDCHRCNTVTRRDQNGQVMAIVQKNAGELKAILAAKLGAGDFQLEMRKDAFGWYADVSGHNKIQISYLQSMADELVEEMRSHYDLKL
jgi:hypothetical protein